MSLATKIMKVPYKLGVEMPFALARGIVSPVGKGLNKMAESKVAGDVYGAGRKIAQGIYTTIPISTYLYTSNILNELDDSFMGWKRCFAECFKGDELALVTLGEETSKYGIGATAGLWVSNLYNNLISNKLHPYNPKKRRTNEAFGYSALALLGSLAASSDSLDSIIESNDLGEHGLYGALCTLGGLAICRMFDSSEPSIVGKMRDSWVANRADKRARTKLEEELRELRN